MADGERAAGELATGTPNGESAYASPASCPPDGGAGATTSTFFSGRLRPGLGSRMASDGGRKLGSPPANSAAAGGTAYAVSAGAAAAALAAAGGARRIPRS